MRHAGVFNAQQTCTKDESEGGSCPRFVSGVDEDLFDIDDRRPRAGGNIDQLCDQHALERHFPLPKAPLFANSTIERE